MKNELVGKYFRVLNDGFVGLVDVMGTDEDIEQAARVSYGKGTRKTSDTRNLIRYLRRHAHSTPFEMVELKFHVRVPMDCWRQWIRHRTASVNEYSTRYSEAINSCAVAGEWRTQSSTNKQGSSGIFGDEWPEGWSAYRHNIRNEIYIQIVDDTGYINTLMLHGSAVSGDPTPNNVLNYLESKHHDESRNLYELRLKLGVAREQARKDLPLSTYTEAFWKIDLHNLFHFLKLRLDSHAQYEIRQYSYVMACIAKTVAPLAFEAFLDYSVYSHNFSRLDMQLMKELLNSKSINRTYLNVRATEIGMSKREVADFWHKIDSADTVGEFDWRSLTEISPASGD